MDVWIYRWLWRKLRVDKQPPRAQTGIPRFPLMLKVLAVTSVITVVVAIVCYFAHAADITTVLIVGVALGVIFQVANQAHAQQQIRRARELDLWPALGEVPTQEHVRRLAQAGEKVLAIRALSADGGGIGRGEGHHSEIPDARAIPTHCGAGGESDRIALLRCVFAGRLLLAALVACIVVQAVLLAAGGSAVFGDRINSPFSNSPSRRRIQLARDARFVAAGGRRAPGQFRRRDEAECTRDRSSGAIDD